MFLAFISLAVILLEGNYYIHSLRRDLTNQALSNVTTVTRQHRQAFDTFISGDRELEQKDKKLDYQERQFNIFSTYLSSNTDDVYLMLDSGANRAEYVSPNMERVLGISAAECLETPRLFNAVQTDSVQTIAWPDLERLELGQELEPRDTERVNRQTGEHKWFRETIYCVSIQGRKKIIAYISDRTKER